MKRSGFVLIAVLVVISISVLVATGVLFIVQGRAADAAGSADAAQSRALAWSGAQAVMAELNSQRDRILSGDSPRLDRQYTIYETNNRLGVVRLLPTASNSAALISAEGGKIDLNAIDAERLAKTGMIDAATAAAIIAYRDQTPGRLLQSELELLNLPGGLITPEMLYGPIDQIKPRDQAQLVQGDLAERVFGRLESRVQSLPDVVTVFSVEPNVQQSGRPRININQPWSKQLEQQIAEQFGQRAAEQHKATLDRGVKFENEGKVIAFLRAANMPSSDWAPILDAVTTTADKDCFGRLDINTASIEALQTLPTITPEQAEQIVNRRESLTGDERGTITWPLLAQIIEPEAMEQLAGKITTRCWTYRVRIAAGEITVDESGGEEGPMNNPIIWEAVIDLSSTQPRIAYLRDISVLQAAAQIALESSLRQPDELEPDAEPSVESSEAPREEEEPSAEAPDEEPRQPAAEVSRKPATPAAKEAASPPAPAAPDQPAPASRRKVGRWLGGT